MYGLSVHCIWYDTVNASGSDVELYWNANRIVSLMMLSGNSEYDGAGNRETQNPACKGTSGCNEILVCRKRL
jgi:hypothetical protein